MNSLINNINKVDQVEFAHATSCNAEDVYKYINVNGKYFSLLTQNIRSIYFNFDNFLVSFELLKFHPDIIILTECWLCDHKPVPVLPN